MLQYAIDFSVLIHTSSASSLSRRCNICDTFVNFIRGLRILFLDEDDDDGGGAGVKVGDIYCFVLNRSFNGVLFKVCA